MHSTPTRIIDNWILGLDAAISIAADIYHDTIIRMLFDGFWEKWLRGLGFSNHIPTQKTWWFIPVHFIAILPAVTHFIGYRRRDILKMSSDFHTLLLHFEIRDAATEPLHYFAPILVHSTAVVRIPPYDLRRVPWNGRSICQDNAFLGTGVIITKLIRLRRLLSVRVVRNRRC